MQNKLTIVGKAVTSKMENAFRLLTLHYLSRSIPTVMVVEYPKSGGTWLGQLLSGYLDIPFPRNQMPPFARSIYHGHYLPSKNFTKLEKILWLTRDGRDVMVSLYHHWLLWNERTLQYEPKNVIYHRNNLQFTDYDNIKANLPAFIEYTFTHRPSRLRHFTFMGNWADFNTRWLGFTKRSSHLVDRVRYEDLRINAVDEMQRVLATDFAQHVDMEKLRAIVERYSFQAQTGRTEGTENKTSFLRKGIIGDWRNHFSQDAAQVFDRFGGQALIDLGYESDRSWVQKVQ